MRKTPPKKRVTRSTRPLSNVDPTRLALAALERIRTVLVRSGHESWIGEPLTMRELAAQGQLMGAELPPSYVATMRVASRIGEPTFFLDAHEIAAEASRIATFGGEEAKRYAPFCRGPEYIVCFDKGGGRRFGLGELPIVEWRDGTAIPVAAHFGEWLDAVADAREDAVETAARMPARLKSLIYDLGFRFEYPIVGHVDTNDVAAIEALIGSELAHMLGDDLFDATGKARLTLDVDAFALTIALRTGTYAFEAEEVFRWLRTFRDENFFSDVVTDPSHPDVVRDLRRVPVASPERHASSEITAPTRISVPPPKAGTSPSSVSGKKLVFRGASGRSADDFYLLAEDESPKKSVILHVVHGAVVTSYDVDEPLFDLHSARGETLWGLSSTHAVRISGGRVQSHVLPRPPHGPSHWYGIGGAGDRVLVWGAGALLEFDGFDFAPFEPDARLDATESVVALHSLGQELRMLVCGDRMGAVASFDAQDWQPIAQHQLIDVSLTDLDVWQDVSYVLDQDGGIWTIDRGPPQAIALPLDEPPFVAEGGRARPLFGLRVHEGGILLASRGGVIAVADSQSVFHPISHGGEAVRLVRLGSVGLGGEAAILALSGPHAFLWESRGFRAVDTRDR